MTPKVLNKYKDNVVGAIYIGRGSKWGNPYSHMSNTAAKYKVATRDEAINAYRDYLLNNHELMSCLSELKGKNLVCFCAPLRCHGDILLELANEA